MALDFQQVYTKIKEIGANVQQRKKILEERRAKARTLLNIYADALDVLRDKVESAKAADPALRCALPLKERLDSHFPPPDLPLNATLVAADGSQIFPDRHGQVQYYLINVGAIAMALGSGKTPQIFIDTKLYYGDDEIEIPSEGQVALQRDLAERRKLLEISKEISGTVITFTEGQIELWGSLENQNKGSFEENLQDYLNVLYDLKVHGVITSGYVDKPGANWFIRLLEIAEFPQTDLESLRDYRPLLGVTDLWLFSQLLGEHERSAVFSLEAKSAQKYKDSLSIHFFYLNIGDENHPAIGRVDIPLWVAQDEIKLNALHQSLIEQSRIMGNKPFPYLLHRAHEIAVVSHQEKNQLDQMLIMEIYNNQGEVNKTSGKKSAKDLPGQTRYKA